MAGKKRRGQKTPNFSTTNPAVNNARAKKLDSYEDTLEPGSTDEHIFRRDQIMFNPQDESDGDDDLGPEGEEVLSLNLPRRRDQQDEDFEEEDYEEEEDDDEEVPTKSKKEKAKEKAKNDLLTKGRFGKPIVSSDEEDEGSSSGSGSGSEDDEEGWGRSYYSRPSSRKEKEDLRGEYDEKKEEEREMEIKEVKRLQRKAREGLADDDWGLADDAEEPEPLPLAQEETPVARPKVAAPETTDPATLLRHLQAYEPVKLALARDLPLTVRKIEKTARGIKQMMAEEEGQETLHKGLGWLHYQTLITYATTLAFYIHLAAQPAATRPDMSNHPIISRLLELKKGVADLEELDFSAGSVSDDDPILESLKEKMGMDPDEELTGEKKLAFMDLLAKMREQQGMDDDEDDEEEMEDSDDEDDFGDFDESWKGAGLDEDELDDLLADANGEDDSDDMEEPVPVVKTKKAKTGKSKSKSATSEDGKKKRSRKVKEAEPTPIAIFTPLAEPSFYSTKSKSKSSRPLTADDDTLGDATALLDADATDKERRTKTLRFHTSKIASTSNRRAAARAQRLGGDEDVPYRDRQKARDAALRKNSASAQDGGEDLDGGEWSESDKKRAREVREEPVDDGPEDDGGAEEYYDLVKRRKTEKIAEKEAAHDAWQADKFASFEDESADGPRALTRAIEKNRGLTPHRNKNGRNPRVKKRVAYEKAKQKVGSQRAVYKGGQATVGGNYQGEKTGISTVAKSRKF